MRYVFNLKIYRLLRNALIQLFVQITGPWIMAKFYAAWEYYQHDEVYRQRLTLLGFKFAYESFVKNRISRDYCLKKRIEKEPALKWKILFLPWSIPRPPIFDTAALCGVL